ncbi:MAG: metallopeptidase family protein [Chloroflexota bacterium]|nr:metallopeptidase family protein [Chloroflexota bacterium]
MQRERFERLVRRALHRLPPAIQKAMENVAIVVEDWPDEQTVAEMGLESPHDLFGLYYGVPLAERGVGGGSWEPDRIVLYQRPIESACATDEEVVREVRTTVLHEVGHYLGMSEADLDRLGYG